MVILDCEERYNAGHALMLVEDHADAVLRLQYRNFCGGCTFTAIMGAGLMSVVGTSWLAWKGVALLFTAVLAAVGTLLLERQIGRAASVAWVLLLCFAPLNWIRLSLLSWGNHVEAGVWAICILAMVLRSGERRWEIGTGALCGVALWFGFSSLFAVAGAFGYRVVQRQWKSLGWMATGVLLAPFLWLLQWHLAGELPFGTIYQEGESIPLLSRIPTKAWTLFAPQQLAGLWGLPNTTLGVPLGISWMASIVGAFGTCGWMLRQRLIESQSRPTSDLPWLAASLIGIWIGIYLVVGFTLQLEPWPIVAAPPGLRYAAPVYPVVFLLLAAITGMAWSTGRRLAATLVLLGPITSGIFARAATITAPFPSDFPGQLQATDAAYFRLQASYKLMPDEHAQCTAESSDSQALHAYSLGRQAQSDLLGEIPQDGLMPTESLSGLTAPSNRPDVAWYEGVGGGLIDNMDGQNTATLAVLLNVHDRLSTLPEAGQQLALDEALWRRVYKTKAWSLGRGELNEHRLLQVLQILNDLPVSLRAGWLRAYGRRWGRVHSRLAQPTEVPFPNLPLDAAEAFANGLGQGLGAEWGPQPAIPAPENMDPALEEALLDGYALGMQRQWRTRQMPQVDHDSSWTDAEAQRWWGPAPPMLCPCGSTCE